MLKCLIACRDSERTKKWVHLLKDHCCVEIVEVLADTKTIGRNFDFAIVHSSDRYNLWDVKDGVTVVGPKDSPQDCCSMPNSRVFLFTREGTSEGDGLIPIHRSTSPFDLNASDVAEILQYVGGAQSVLPRCCRPEENYSAAALAILMQAYFYVGFRTKQLGAVSTELASFISLPAQVNDSDLGTTDEEHKRLWEHLQSCASWKAILCVDPRISLQQALTKSLGERLSTDLASLAKDIDANAPGKKLSPDAVLSAYKVLVAKKTIPN